MTTLIVMENPGKWKLHVAGAEVISARDYLSEERFALAGRVKVFNLCRSYRYQSAGYYVSLLAAARGHNPIPSVTTIQDLGIDAVVKQISHEYDMLIQRSLKKIRAEQFELSVYFGQNVASCHQRLSKAIFSEFPVPFFRAFFHRDNGRWNLDRVKVITVRDIPEHHHDFMKKRITAFVGRPVHKRPVGNKPYRYEMAILTDPSDPFPPSDTKALAQFEAAADRLSMGIEYIDRNDFGSIDRYDALFIRTTTAVDHYTYRFARRAEVSGLVVIDDPLSILRCANKIYLYERLRQQRIPLPETLIANRDSIRRQADNSHFPLVVKIPDGSFSRGVFKVNDARELIEKTAPVFENSDLILLQRFMPTDYDWRIGVFNHQPVFACQYFMARNHWQIYHHDGRKTKSGGFKTLPLAETPDTVLEAAARASALIGDGLYGVDIKYIGGIPYIIEINDNPNIDSGVEDNVLKQELYTIIMREFIRRLDAARLK